MWLLLKSFCILLHIIKYSYLWLIVWFEVFLSNTNNYMVVLLWIPTHGRAKAGRPARTYIQQLCEDTGCCPEDLPRAMNDREEWWERVRDIRATSAIWWWWWFLIKNDLQLYGFKYSYQIGIVCKQIFWSIDGALKSTKTPGQSGSRSNDNESRTPQSPDINIWSFTTWYYWVSYPGHPFFKRCLVWGYSPEDLWSVEYTFVAIIRRFTLTPSASAC